MSEFLASIVVYGPLAIHNVWRHRLVLVFVNSLVVRLECRVVVSSLTEDIMKPNVAAALRLTHS